MDMEGTGNGEENMLVEDGEMVVVDEEETNDPTRINAVTFIPGQGDARERYREANLMKTISWIRKRVKGLITLDRSSANREIPLEDIQRLTAEIEEFNINVELDELANLWHQWRGLARRCRTILKKLKDLYDLAYNGESRLITENPTSTKRNRYYKGDGSDPWDWQMKKYIQIYSPLTLSEEEFEQHQRRLKELKLQEEEKERVARVNAAAIELEEEYLRWASDPRELREDELLEANAEVIARPIPRQQPIVTAEEMEVKWEALVGAKMLYNLTGAEYQIYKRKLGEFKKFAALYETRQYLIPGFRSIYKGRALAADVILDGASEWNSAGAYLEEQKQLVEDELNAQRKAWDEVQGYSYFDCRREEAEGKTRDRVITRIKLQRYPHFAEVVKGVQMKFTIKPYVMVVDPYDPRHWIQENERRRDEGMEDDELLEVGEPVPNPTELQGRQFITTVIKVSAHENFVELLLTNSDEDKRLFEEYEKGLKELAHYKLGAMDESSFLRMDDVLEALLEETHQVIFGLFHRNHFWSQFVPRGLIPDGEVDLSEVETDNLEIGELERIQQAVNGLNEQQRKALYLSYKSESATRESISDEDFIYQTQRRTRGFMPVAINGPTLSAIHGPPGTGKTHLAATIIAFWYAQNRKIEEIRQEKFNRLFTRLRRERLEQMLKKRTEWQAGEVGQKVYKIMETGTARPRMRISEEELNAMIVIDTTPSTESETGKVQEMETEGQSESNSQRVPELELKRKLWEARRERLAESRSFRLLEEPNVGGNFWNEATWIYSIFQGRLVWEGVDRQVQCLNKLLECMETTPNRLVDCTRGLYGLIDQEQEEARLRNLVEEELQDETGAALLDEWVIGNKIKSIWEYFAKPCWLPKILVCAASNGAVDNIFRNVSQILPGRALRLLMKDEQNRQKWYTAEERKHVLISMIDADETIDRYRDDLEGCSTKKERAEINSKINIRIQEITNEAVLKHDIICSTCSMAGCYVLSGRVTMQEREGGPKTLLGRQIKWWFNRVLVDEAGFASEPEILIPLTNVNSRRLDFGGSEGVLTDLGRIVLVGDHKQLGPVTLSKKKRTWRRSLLERLVIHYGIPITHLTVQYRGHSELIKFHNALFYNGTLTTGAGVDEARPLPKDVIFPIVRRSANPGDTYIVTQGFPLNWEATPVLERFEPRFFVLHTGILSKETKRGHSFVNPVEAWYVLRVAQALDQRGRCGKRITILSLYKEQLNEIARIEKGCYFRRVEDGEEFDKHTVDSFQGKENDIILVATTRTERSIGFTDDERRLNVCLSRARHLCILFANINLLVSKPEPHTKKAKGNKRTKTEDSNKSENEDEEQKNEEEEDASRIHKENWRRFFKLGPVIGSVETFLMMNMPWFNDYKSAKVYWEVTEGVKEWKIRNQGKKFLFHGEGINQHWEISKLNLEDRDLARAELTKRLFDDERPGRWDKSLITALKEEKRGNQKDPVELPAERTLVAVVVREEEMEPRRVSYAKLSEERPRWPEEDALFWISERDRRLRAEVYEKGIRIQEKMKKELSERQRMNREIRDIQSGRRGEAPNINYNYRSQDNDDEFERPFEYIVDGEGSTNQVSRYENYYDHQSHGQRTSRSRESKSSKRYKR